MTRWIKRVVVISAAWAAAGTSVSAQDVGATASGNWNDPTIWTTAAVPGSSNNVFIGSTTPAGSAAIATVTLTQNQSAGNLTLGDGNNTHGTLDLGSNTLTIADTLTIGLNGGLGTIVEGPGGSFTASTVNVESTNSLTFGSKDVTATLFVYSGSTATTSSAGNVTGNVNVLSGSTLNLGANLNLSGQLDVENTGSAVHMNGFNISAGTILLGQFGNQAVTLDRGATPGSLTAGTLYIAQGTLNLIPADAITNLNLDNKATVTTAATGNVTGSLTVYSGSTLNLGANLKLSGFIDVEDSGSVINAHGFSITSSTLQLGLFNPGATTVTNVGPVTVESLYLGHGSTLTVPGGSQASSLISLAGGSVLTVQQTNGIGLTLSVASDSSLSIDNTSSMHLIFNLNTAPNWDFRWAGDHASALMGLIASHQITIDAPQGYFIDEKGGYTYIEGGFSAVPEPSSIILACLACAGVAMGARCRRRRTMSR